MIKKTLLITGSTDGIGKLAATRLAEEGHEVCIHGRHREKVEAVLSEIKTKTKNHSIRGFVADFSDLSSVKKVSQNIIEELTKIDVLVNNAGVFKSPDHMNKDGLDMRIVVNYLAPYVLTNELLSLLHKGDGARIINVSSAAQSPISAATLFGQEQRSAQNTYAQSKLALTMWSFDLAHRLDNIAVVAVNPGSLLNTRMVQEAYGTFWSPAEVGAEILCQLALSDDPTAINGKYFDNDKGGFGDAHPDAYDQRKIEQLIKLTDQLLGLDMP